MLSKPKTDKDRPAARAATPDSPPTRPVTPKPPKTPPPPPPPRRDEFVKAALTGLAANPAIFPRVKDDNGEWLADVATMLADAAIAKLG